MATEQAFASPEVAGAWLHIERSLDAIVQLVAESDPAALNWQPPAADGNSIYVLAVHILGAAGEGLLSLAGDFAGGRDRDAEFRAAGESAEFVTERWSALAEQLGGLLSSITTEQLNAQYDHPRYGSVTRLEAMLTVADHAALHLGHAELTRDLWEQSQRDFSRQSPGA